MGGRDCKFKGDLGNMEYTVIDRRGHRNDAEILFHQM